MKIEREGKEGFLTRDNSFFFRNLKILKNKIFFLQKNFLKILWNLFMNKNYFRRKTFRKKIIKYFKLNYWIKMRTLLFSVSSFLLVFKNILDDKFLKQTKKCKEIVKNIVFTETLLQLIEDMIFLYVSLFSYSHSC